MDYNSNKFKDFLEVAEENPVITFLVFLIFLVFLMICTTIGEIGVAAFNAIGKLVQ